jgi:hypothetical protein
MPDTVTERPFEEITLGDFSQADVDDPSVDVSGCLLMYVTTPDDR